MQEKAVHKIRLGTRFLFTAAVLLLPEPASVLELKTAAGKMAGPAQSRKAAMGQWVVAALTFPIPFTRSPFLPQNLLCLHKEHILPLPAVPLFPCTLTALSLLTSHPPCLALFRSTTWLLRNELYPNNWIYFTRWTLYFPSSPVFISLYSAPKCLHWKP